LKRHPTNFAKLLQTAHRIHAQQRHDKNKIYSVHEPEVECIAKGKAGKQYEFGNKVSVAVSSRGGWFVGAKSFTGNPYDGHTLAEQMKQVENLIGEQGQRSACGHGLSRPRL
jgi:IS5 family transposase